LHQIGKGVESSEADAVSIPDAARLDLIASLIVERIKEDQRSGSLLLKRLIEAEKGNGENQRRRSDQSLDAKAGL